MTGSANTNQPSQASDEAPIPRAHAQYSKKAKVVDKNTELDSDQEESEEEEEDEYEKRIARTGCAAENEALQLCYAEKHDWRACQDAMKAFRECWARNGNIQAEE